ncbi:DUF2163 domain-containing protein [Camelimonas abortus]|uniref:DUF2163 domain-containing protein n=1 Tax=Camelimonas abortus TaxID=1017184 RepID=A0ABV7LFM4_9HYPH
MRAIPPGLAERLESDAATLAHCWRLIRADGVVMGFTDHDRDIAFGGVTCRAGAGWLAAGRASEAGFAVGGGEVAGALSSEAITAADIAAGRYDGAQVELWLVDWRDPERRMLLDVATTGEIRRAGDAFHVELRTVMHRLDQTQGRVYGSACDADLGDSRCGVSLDDPAFRGEGTVTAADGDAGFFCSGLDGFADGLFRYGRLMWTSGANAGLACDVQSHAAGPGAVRIGLWRETPRPFAAGDAFTVTAGCDRRLATCRDRFNNVINFRGFPYMPGNDFTLGSAAAGQPMDGGSMFR